MVSNWQFEGFAEGIGPLSMGHQKSGFGWEVAFCEA